MFDLNARGDRVTRDEPSFCLVCVKTETDARSRWKIRGHNNYNGEGKLIRSEDCSFPGIELQIRSRLERRKHDILECCAIIVLRHAFFYTLAEFFYNS